MYGCEGMAVKGDSVKREFKRRGETGIQGEFGIGLLSF